MNIILFFWDDQMYLICVSDRITWIQKECADLNKLQYDIGLT